jgi:hypothetical protein
MICAFFARFSPRKNPQNIQDHRPPPRQISFISNSTKKVKRQSAKTSAMEETLAKPKLCELFFRFQNERK